MTETINTHPKLIRHEKYLGLTIVAQLGPEGYHVDYRIYQIYSHEPELCWVVRDRDNFTDDLEKASVFIHGYVKWDGCSNWHFDICDKVMLHGCEKEDLTRIGTVLGICWDWTREICPHWLDC